MADSRSKHLQHLAVLLSAGSDRSFSGEQEGTGTASPGWEETHVQGRQAARVKAPPQRSSNCPFQMKILLSGSTCPTLGKGKEL